MYITGKYMLRKAIPIFIVECMAKSLLSGTFVIHYISCNT